MNPLNYFNKHTFPDEDLNSETIISTIVISRTYCFYLPHNKRSVKDTFFENSNKTCIQHLNVHCDVMTSSVIDPAYKALSYLTLNNKNNESLLLLLC